MTTELTDASTQPVPEGGEPSQNVGDRLRRRRKALGLTLKAVADESGLTQGFLSQIERGQANASVRALQSICQVLRLNVGDLFDDAAGTAHRVMRFRDTRGFSFGDRATKTKLTPAVFDHLEVLLGHFEPGGSTGVDPYTHGSSEELLIVLSGRVEMTVGGERYELEDLDSVHYRSDQPHRVAELTGTAPARVLWAIAPPTY
jgi:transcriptional regulator with XRE-family HTH domain